MEWCLSGLITYKWTISRSLDTIQYFHCLYLSIPVTLNSASQASRTTLYYCNPWSGVKPENWVIHASAHPHIYNTRLKLFVFAKAVKFSSPIPRNCENTSLSPLLKFLISLIQAVNVTAYYSNRNMEIEQYQQLLFQKYVDKFYRNAYNAVFWILYGTEWWFFPFRTVHENSGSLNLLMKYQ